MPAAKPHTSGVMATIQNLLDDAFTNALSDPPRAVQNAYEALALVDDLLARTLTPAERAAAYADRTTALLVLCQHERNTGRTADARRRLDEADGAARASADPRTIAKVLLMKGSHDVLAGDITLAEEALVEAQATFESIGAADGAIMARYNLAMAAARSGRPALAYERYSTCYEAAASEGLHQVEAGCLSSLGALNEQRASYTDALTWYQKAIELARATNDRYSLGIALGNAATAMFNAGYTDESRRLFDEAIDIIRELGNTMLLATLRNNQAGYERRAGFFREALAMHDEAVVLAERTAHHREHIVALCGRASCLHQLGRHREATATFERANKVARSLSDPRALLHVLVEHLDVLVARKQWAKAHHLVNEALALQDHIDMSTYGCTLLQQAALVLEHHGDIAGALAMHRRFHAEFEQRHSEEAATRLELHAAALRLTLAERDKEILRLQNDILTASNEARLREIQSLRLQLASGGDADRSAVRERLAFIDSGLSERLAARCPDLTPTEIRVCTLLKIGLSTKDLAALLHVTERAVEKHRYNIRRKLALDPSVSLTTWLERVGREL